MTEGKPKGRVGFRQPPAKLVADMPGDDEMREHLEETMKSDGFPGSCGVVDVTSRERE